MFSSTTSQFCVFCYKTFDLPTETTESSSDGVKTFLKTLRKFVKCPNVDQNNWTKYKLNTIDKFLECCKNCTKSMTEFCEIYHQIELLKLQLDLKLNNLVEKIEYANKVPSRWISVNKLIEESKGNELTNFQGLIRSFRQGVLQSEGQRRLQAQPRVLMTKIEKITTGPIDADDNASNYEGENQIVVEEPQIEIKLEYPIAVYDNDHNEQFAPTSLKTQDAPVSDEQNTVTQSSLDKSCVTPIISWELVKGPAKIDSQTKNCRSFHICTVCNSTLRTSKSAKYHSRKEHYKCPDCDYVTATKSYRSRHAESCRKKKLVMSSLSFWLKQYACSECPNRYKTVAALYKHRRDKHKSSTPSVCTLCDRVFTQKDNLRTHMKTIHPTVQIKPSGNQHEETTPLKQEGASQIVEKEVKRRKKTEDGEIRNLKNEKVFNCRFCNKRLYSACALTKHVSASHLDRIVRTADEKKRQNDTEENSDNDSCNETKKTKKLVEESSKANTENGEKDKISVNECLSVEIKREVVTEVILSEIAGEDGNVENYICETSKMTNVINEMEVNGEEDYLNTFGKNLDCLDTGALAELEDLD